MAGMAATTNIARSAANNIIFFNFYPLTRGLTLQPVSFHRTACTVNTQNAFLSTFLKKT